MTKTFQHTAGTFFVLLTLFLNPSVEARSKARTEAKSFKIEGKGIRASIPLISADAIKLNEAPQTYAVLDLLEIEGIRQDFLSLVKPIEDIQVLRTEQYDWGSLYTLVTRTKGARYGFYLQPKISAVTIRVAPLAGLHPVEAFFDFRKATFRKTGN